MRIGVPPVGSDLKQWGNSLRLWLARSWDSLTFKDATSQASQDGVILWDPAGYPVVSKGGEWRQVVLSDGFAWLSVSADITAAAPDTAYPVVWDASALIGGISIASGSRVTFDEGGKYLLSFSAQIRSSTSSAVNFRFWPRVNGVDASGSTIVAHLHDNNATTVVSRTALFQVSSGDYIEAIWAVDDTNGLLKAEAATAYAPSAPAVTMTISRVSQ